MDNFRGKSIILIGFMGTGKTIVGRLLAERLGREFIDTDELVEEAMGLSIPLIFRRYGESRFRAEEKAAVARATARQGAVIATGGGAVLDPENVARLKEAGVIIWLQATPEAIFERTGRGEGRPLLEGRHSVEVIAGLLERRMPYYQQAADLIINTTGRPPEEIARQIEQELNLWSPN
ncbi:MAG: shikimate kinase [Clostridia bacterium]|nr:shikimate kinase [Clostridia bacterium]